MTKLQGDVCNAALRYVAAMTTMENVMAADSSGESVMYRHAESNLNTAWLALRDSTNAFSESNIAAWKAMEDFAEDQHGGTL